MDAQGDDRNALAPAAPAPVAPNRRGGERRAAVVDAEFRVIHPWRLWRRFRDGWWAIGPYLAYCTALWGLAALVAWLMDHGRAG
jgi:hypothetical protein